MELANELLVALFSEVTSISTLLVLASASRFMRQVGLLDPRLQVLQKCHMAAIRHVRDKPTHCMFSNDMADLRLELSQHSHRFALYPIMRTWPRLPVSSLGIRGDLDLIAAVKLDALLSISGFECKEITFTCVSFNDDEDTVKFLKMAFAKCSSIRFNLCSFDQDSLVQLLRMVGGSTLCSFHFVSNFVDSFPVDVLCDAIAAAPHLKVLDVAGAGLGWESDLLTTFLDKVAATPITHLSLTNNDITTITLPTFPNLKYLNLESNPLSPDTIPACTSFTISI